MQYVKYSEMTNSGPVPRVSKLIADDLCSVIVCHIITHCTPLTIVKHFHTSLINGRSTHQTNWGHTLSAYNFDKEKVKVSFFVVHGIRLMRCFSGSCTCTHNSCILGVSAVVDTPASTSTQSKTGLVPNTVQIVQPDRATSLSVKGGRFGAGPHSTDNTMSK